MGKIRELYHDDEFSLVGDEQGVHYIRGRDRVQIVPITTEGEVMLVEAASPAFGRVFTLPGGALDGTESISGAAQRELQAQTGCAAISLVMLGEVRPWVNCLQVRTFVYLARHLQPCLPPGDAVVHDIRLMRIALRHFDQLIAAAELHDASTIAALYITRDYLYRYSSGS